MSDHLSFSEEPEGLRRPLVIMAFSGWNDAAESATTAARYLSQLWSARTFASIDPEEFYHFGLSRPYVRFKTDSRTEREIIWPATEFSLAQPSEIERDLIVGVAIEPHLKWRTYCGAILDLARRVGASLVLTLGALLGEVPHTRPVRLSGSAYDPEPRCAPRRPLDALRGAHRYRRRSQHRVPGQRHTHGEPVGECAALHLRHRDPKAALALVRRVLGLLNTEADLSDLTEAARQFEQNLNGIVAQNAKIAEYVSKLERKKPDEDEEAADGQPGDELPPSADLVAEIEQFLRQQRPEGA